MSKLDIMDLMADLDDLLKEKYNATLKTKWEGYWETFASWPEDLQEKITQIENPQILGEYFERVETCEIDYFDIVFD